MYYPWARAHLHFACVCLYENKSLCFAWSVCLNFYNWKCSLWSLSLLQLQDAGCWTDAATLAATHLQGSDYARFDPLFFFLEESFLHASLISDFFYLKVCLHHISYFISLHLVHSNLGHKMAVSQHWGFGNFLKSRKFRLQEQIFLASTKASRQTQILVLIYQSDFILFMEMTSFQKCSDSLVCNVH